MSNFKKMSINKRVVEVRIGLPIVFIVCPRQCTPAVLLTGGCVVQIGLRRRSDGPSCITLNTKGIFILFYILHLQIPNNLAYGLKPNLACSTELQGSVSHAPLIRRPIRVALALLCVCVYSTLSWHITSSNNVLFITYSPPTVTGHLVLQPTK